MEQQQEWEVDIGNLLNLFHESAARSDFDQYFNCFASNGCFVGSDATEYWTVEQFKVYCEPHFRSPSAWVYLPISGKRTLFPFSSTPQSPDAPVMASFDELLHAKSLNCDVRGTGTVVWNTEQRRWEILSYYLSFPIPDAVGSRVTRLIGDHLSKPSSSSSRTRIDPVEMKKLEDDAEAAAAALLAELDLESKPSASSKKASKPNKKKGKGKR
jgi:hypothetical protein